MAYQCKQCSRKEAQNYRNPPLTKLRDQKRRTTEKFKQHRREQYANDPQRFRNTKNQSYAKRADKINQKRRRERDKRRIEAHKQRSRKRSLPCEYTETQWQHALNYWHGCCAYCGNQPGLFDYNQTLHQDHYIPLSNPDCPGTVIANMLPSCQSCNLSKGNKNPIKWLTEKLGTRKAKIKLAEIETYFASLV